MATATVTKGYNNPTGWISGETVTPEKLNSSQTPSVSVTIDDGDITASKLATGAVTGAAGGGKLAESAISGQTAITTLEGTDAFLVWDDTDDTLKKITQTNLSTQIVGDASITAAKINGVAKDGSGSNIAVGNPPIFGCRAWVNFDGTKDTSGAASTSNTNRLIRASGNVTSVLRNAAGDYTVTFTTAMPDANYSWSVSGHRGDGASVGTGMSGAYSTSSNAYTSATTTTLRVVTNTGAGSGIDWPAVCMSIFR
jgi:hypothetical protein